MWSLTSQRLPLINVSEREFVNLVNLFKNHGLSDSLHAEMPFATKSDYAPSRETVSFGITLTLPSVGTGLLR